GGRTGPRATPTSARLRRWRDAESPGEEFDRFAARALGQRAVREEANLPALAEGGVGVEKGRARAAIPAVIAAGIDAERDERLAVGRQRFEQPLAGVGRVVVVLVADQDLHVRARHPEVGGARQERPA